MRRSLIPLLLFLLPAPAPACSLCGPAAKQTSLAFEFEQAAVVVYGKLANPQLDLKAGNGRGTTEFHIEMILKDDRDFPKKKMIVLSRYLPILDAKKPPHFVMFIRAPKKSLEPYWGREVTSVGVLHFVAEMQRYRSDPAQKLQFAARHFDAADEQVAAEAFLTFAKADDKLIAKTAKQLAPESLRKLIKNPDLEPERLSMFAYLLGACGNAADGEALHALLMQRTPGARNYKSFEGILAGYVALKPKDGWAYIHDTLKNPKAPFLLRYAALRTMRFFYNARPQDNGAEVMQGLAEAIERPDVADIAITDLRTWKRWEHTKLIAASYGKKTHQAPIVKNSIVRYALACPRPEARALVERVRREDPELIRYLEEELK